MNRNGSVLSRFYGEDGEEGGVTQEIIMEQDTIVILVAAAAILGFLWNLHRDVADLRERMARLEGLFEGFTRRGPEGPQG